MDRKCMCRAWVVLLSAILSTFLEGGLTKSFGVLLKTITEQENIMVWQVGNTVSLMSIIGAFTAMAASPLMKYIYPRYLLFAAGFMMGSGFVLASIAPNWLLISLPLILLTGIGVRCCLTCTMSVLPDYFDQHLLLAAGLTYAGSPLGTMVFAPLSQLWLDSFGWRASFLLLGATAFNGMVCGALIKPQARKSQTTSNEDKGSEQPRQRYLEKLHGLFDLALFKNFSFIALLVADFSVCVAWQGWRIYLIPHGEEKGLTPYQSSAPAITGGVGFCIGLMIPACVVDTGYITDQQARLLSFIVLTITFMIDPWIDSFVGQLILSPLCTVAMGTAYTTTMSIAMRVSVGNVAQVVSFSQFVSATGKYIGGTITGLLFDISGSYDPSFLFIGGTQAITSIVIGLAIVFEQKQQQS